MNKIDGLSGKELGLVLKKEPQYAKYLSGLAFGLAQNKIIKSETYLEDYFYTMNIRTFEEIIQQASK